MLDRLEIIERRYDELNTLLSDVNIATDIKRMTTLSKEQRSIQEIVEKYRDYKNTLSQLDEVKALLKEHDPEIREMAEMEKATLEERIEVLEEELKVLLLPKDPNDDKNVIVEIRGAAGGDEANIFAGDLFKMYAKYAETKGWKIEVLNAMESPAGGYTQIEFMITGDQIYSFMKYESGTHRVQRVPETESQGRIHTSTSTVLVMPEAEEVEIEVSMADLRVDTFCSSGPGGQSVNTTKSAVRLTHIPTGLSVACQEGKSQHENKDKALKLLKTRLYDMHIQEQLEKEGAERKALIGRGDRSEKVRTYNYPQNRVTDHRINLTLQRLDAIMVGRLDLVIDALINEDQKQRLSGETE